MRAFDSASAGESAVVSSLTMLAQLEEAAEGSEPEQATHTQPPPDASTGDAGDADTALPPCLDPESGLGRL